MQANSRMIKTIFYTTLMHLAFAGSAACQNVNLIIQVNERLIISGLTNIYFTIDSVTNRQKFYVSYVPGDLTLSPEFEDKIGSDTSSKLFLHFDYNIYSKENEVTANFYSELSQKELKEPYLILNIYDFRDKKYRHWYSWHTEKEFLSELTFPGSGLYIRQK